MAANTPGPDDSQKPVKPRKRNSWLTTSDWLNAPGTDTPLPLQAESALTSDSEPSGPGSNVPVGEEEDSAAGPSSSKIISKSDLADVKAAMDDEEAIDLATPPDGAATGPPSLSKILKATGTKSDILRGTPKTDENAPTPTATPMPAWTTKRAAGTDPTSDIFTGSRSEKPESGSNLLPGLSGVDHSSVFGPAQSDPSTPASGGGVDSDLFGGLTGASRTGSNALPNLANQESKTLRPSVDDSNLFLAAEASGAEGDRSSVRLDDPKSSRKDADDLLAQLSSGRMSRPDFDAIDKSSSGSNLFDDVTAVEIELGNNPASGTSGVNWTDPDRTGVRDSGPGSSIFQRPPLDASADPEHIDLSRIPMMGSSVNLGDADKPVDPTGPTSSVLKKEIDKTMAELKTPSSPISFMRPESDHSSNWKKTAGGQTPRPLSKSGEERSTQSPAPSDDSNVLPLKVKSKKDTDSVFDDTFEVPGGSDVELGTAAPMSGSILQGMTSDRMPQVTLPTPQRPSRRASSFDVEVQEKSRPAISRGLLYAAAALVIGFGLGLGLGGQFLSRSEGEKRSTEPTEIVDAATRVDTKTFLANGDAAGARDAFKAVGAESTGQLVSDLIDASLKANRASVEASLAGKKATSAEASAKKARGELDAAVAAKTSAESAMVILKTELTDKSKSLEESRAAAATAVRAAEDKLKKLDASVDSLIAQLKAAKLIDEKATRDEAIAALPDAAKKAATIMSSGGQTADLARELNALKDKSKKELADAEKKIESMDAAVSDAQKKADAEIAKLKVSAESERLAAEKKLRDLEEHHQRALAAVRGGVVVGISDSERRMRDEAAREYGQGLEAFFAGRLADAERRFAGATEKYSNDARYWYFLGLSNFLQYRDAAADFLKGAKLESLGHPAVADIGADLTRVQGKARDALEAARP